jgi:hypothetical protein
MKSGNIDIIILRGAPGSGKTQAANSLSGFFPNGVKVEVDLLRQMVISVDWTNQEEHINMLNLSTGLVYDFFKLGFTPVIVIDTFSGNKLNKYLNKLYDLDKGLRIKIFGLFTTDDELKRRIELRATGQFRDLAICQKLNNAVVEMKYDSENQINTTGLSSSQTAEKIYEYCKDK